MLVSIIVPIYNVEKYLSRCLDSIVNQTHKELEVLLVDDGSPDKCGEICDEYAQKDSRIKVFHIPNGGVANARRYGWANSAGEWMMFVDSDDWMPLDAVEKLLSEIADDVDVILGGYSYEYYDGRKVENTVHSTIMNQRELIKGYVTGLYFATPWAKLYRKAIFTQKSFPKLKLGQDGLMNLEVCSRVNHAKTIKSQVYCYYCGREDSSMKTNKVGFDYWKGYISSLQIIMQENMTYDKYREEFAIFSLYTIRRMLKQGNKFNIKDCWIDDFIEQISMVNLSLKDKLTYYSLFIPFMQEVLVFSYKYHKTYLKIKNIFKRK